MQLDTRFITPQAAVKTWRRPRRQKWTQASITTSTQQGHDPTVMGASSGPYWITLSIHLVRISQNIQTQGKDLCNRTNSSLSAKNLMSHWWAWSALKPFDPSFRHCGVCLFVQIWFHINPQGDSTAEQHSPSEDQSIFNLLIWTKARFIMAECNCSVPSSSAKVPPSIRARKQIRLYTLLRFKSTLQLYYCSGKAQNFQPHLAAGWACTASLTEHKEMIGDS